MYPWVGKIPWRRKCQPTPTLAWRLPWTEEPGGLWSTGSQRVGHEKATQHTPFHTVPTSLLSVSASPLRMDAEILVHIYNGKLLSLEKKNTFESVLMRWMKPEPNVQGEVSHKEKDKYCMLTYVYGIQIVLMKLFPFPLNLKFYHLMLHVFMQISQSLLD